MAEKHFVIDGDSTLPEQEDTLNTAQNMLRARVTVYAKGEQSPPGANTATTQPEHPNFVTTERVGPGEVKELFLVIPDDVAAEDIRQAGKQPSRKRVFFNDVFVEGVIRKVAGYR